MDNDAYEYHVDCSLTLEMTWRNVSE